jgi:PAP2 superfamily
MSPVSLHMPKKPRWRAPAVAAVLLLALASPVTPDASAHARGRHGHSAASVISWNATATDALAVDAKFGPPLVFVGISYVQAAVYNAVVGVEGGYEQYKWHARAHHGTSVDAAVAAAAHRMLLTYAPAAQVRVDAAYATALAAIPDGWAKDAGIAFGERAAAHIVALRTGDGWMAPIQFTMAPAPGVWRPTLPGNLPFAAPWLGEMRPFLLHSHDQFRPSGPRSLTSARYARDLNEVESVGSATSTTRTDLQTEIAHLYGDNNFGVQLQGAFRDHLTRHPHGIAWAARYFAGADLAAADAAISAWDAKFVYGTWRPMTAIQLADTDGNPATVADPTWQPLIVTPNHPDYLSGHTTVSGAVTTALTRLTGTSRIDLNVPSPANLTVPTRHYEWAGQLNADSIGARIWAGIHTRTADEVGNRVGKKVGRFGMRHYFHATD